MRLKIRTFLLLLIAHPGWAQIQNIVLDSIATGRPPAEPSIVINPSNTDNIVGAAILDKVYTTTDGGKTWKTQQLKSQYGVWGDPALVCDEKGNFYYFHLSDPTGKNWQSDEILDRIVVNVSKDGGLTWDDGNSIGENAPKDQDKPWGAYHPINKNLMVSWTQFDKYGSKDPGDKSNILFSKSSNGKNWSKPIRLNKLSGDCLDDDNTVEGAVPAPGLNGAIYVSWSYNEKIYFDRSFDKGKTWLENDLEIERQPGGWSMDIPGVNRCNGMPVMVTDMSKGKSTGVIYLVWADQRNGENDTDIWFIRSTTHGDRWTSALRVNNDEPGKQQFLPWMAVDNITGFIYIVFYDRRAYDDNQTDVYLAWSTDNGNSFKNKKISEKPFTPVKEKFLGDYINITAHKGRIVPIWTRMDNGKTSIVTAVISHKDLGLPELAKEGKKKKKKD